MRSTPLSGRVWLERAELPQYYPIKHLKNFFTVNTKKYLFLHSRCGRFSGTHVIKQDAIYVCSCNLKINNIEKNSPLNKVNSSIFKTSGLVYLDTISFVCPKRSICPPIGQFQCLKGSPSLCSLQTIC